MKRLQAYASYKNHELKGERVTDTQKVVFTRNVLDDQTQIPYFAGDERELPVENAGRMVSGGYAKVMQEEPTGVQPEVQPVVAQPEDAEQFIQQ